MYSRPGTARRHLVRRQVLQPHLACGDRRAHRRHDEEEPAVDDRAAPRRAVHRRDGEHDHHVDEGDALQHAQRARLLVLEVLEVVREAEQPRADEEPERVAEARRHT